MPTEEEKIVFVRARVLLESEEKLEQARQRGEIEKAIEFIKKAVNIVAQGLSIVVNILKIASWLGPFFGIPTASFSGMGPFLHADVLFPLGIDLQQKPDHDNDVASPQEIVVEVEVVEADAAETPLTLETAETPVALEALITPQNTPALPNASTAGESNVTQEPAPESDS